MTKEKEIYQLFEALFKAWEKGDGDLYASCFTEDSDYVTFAGERLKGRKANADAHRQLFKGILKRSRLSGEITSIGFLSEEIALVHVVGGVQMRWQKKAPADRKSINTNVIVKENGMWKIAAFHNCRIHQPGWLLKFLMWLKKGKDN